MNYILHAKMNYIDYIKVCSIFLIPNEKNISMVKNTQRSYTIYNIGNISKTTHDLDNFSFFKL